LIRGVRETGNSLIWLAEQADRGAIIDQTVIPITGYDTCATLYAKVSESNRHMILKVLPRLLNGERPGRPQALDDEPDLPARRPDDGLVNWRQPNDRVYDFIRALTKPYPGARSWLDNRQYRVWQAGLLPSEIGNERAGRILGPVFSPRREACGLVVACERGSIILLELEDDQGRILTGSDLSEQPWIGKVWGSA
jgi:methionyl-tRNA formyltransferase